MRPVRLALVGYGKWGKNYVKAAKDSGAAEVTEIVTRTGQQLPDVLDRVDAVVIAVHPSAAPSLCEIALAAGKLVMIEKPAGLSLSDAQKIAYYEKHYGGMVLVAHQHLFAEAMERVADKGSPWPLRARWHGPPAHDFPGLWDYGPHAVSAILAARGRLPDRVQHFDMGPRGNAIEMWYGNRTDRAFVIMNHAEKIALLHTEKYGALGDHCLYDGYATAEPALTRAVRAFAGAVRVGGTDDKRFGARWAVHVASVLDPHGFEGA